MIYYKGDILSRKDLDDFLENFRQSNELLHLKLNEIISELNYCFERNSKELSNFFNAQDKNLLSELFNTKNLYHRVYSDLGNHNALDELIRSEKGNYRYKYQPHGILLNISASNVLLGVIDNILNCLLTKNKCLIKISHSNSEIIQICTLLFKDSILFSQFALIQFKGGDKTIESSLVSISDAIVLWGGEDLISTYKSNYPNKHIISHGPRVSFSVIDTRFSYNQKDLINDFTRWNQKACSNTQVLFLLNENDPNRFIKKLYEELLENEIMHTSDENEQVEILKELEWARYNSFQSGLPYFYQKNKFLIYYDNEKNFNTTALNNTLKIIQVNSINEIIGCISAFKDYFQSVSSNMIDQSRIELFEQFTNLGVSRLTQLGKITEGVLGMPHEGEYPLKELVKICIDQAEVELVNHSLDSYDAYLYASGGTTGEPKIRPYSYGEFNYIAFKLSQTYLPYIKKDHHIIANMFMAGGLWSSFNVIQKAIELIGATQMPLGASLDKESLRYFFEKLKPNIIFSIPSILYDFALYLKRNEIQISVEYIFFAGEKLLEHHANLFQDVFQSPSIRSAGYACVDIGLIGYQGDSHKRDEFYLFDDIEYAIEHNELLVKPVGHKDFYHTSDRVELLDGKGFRLLGRIDKQFNIWGARLSLDLMDKHFGEFQATLRLINDEEILVINTLVQINQDKLLSFYKDSHDLNKTIPDFHEFIKKVLIINEKFTASRRTGKVPKLLDLRSKKEK